MAKSPPGSGDPLLSGESGGIPAGSLIIPQQEMEVEVISPPRIVWYWVLKQNIDRLKDAINAERADRRIEYLFGCAGLALGTVKDALSAFFTVLNNPANLTLLDIGFAFAFLLSSCFIYYFWRLADNKESTANQVLKDIFEKEYEGNVTRSSSESRGGATGGQAETVREGESGSIR